MATAAATLRNCVSRVTRRDATRTPPRDEFLVSRSLSLSLSLPSLSAFLLFFHRANNRETTSGSPGNVTASNTIAALPSIFLCTRRYGRPTATRKSGVSLVTQSDKHAPFRLHFLRQAASRMRSTSITHCPIIRWVRTPLVGDSKDLSCGRPNLSA